MARYKLRRKRNGISREKSDLWYAEPSPAQRMKARQLCRFATQHTTMGNMELMMALEILAQYLPAVLAQGTIVEVGRLGTLQLAYGSEGVEEPEDFNYHLIRRPRVAFRPSRELTQEVERLISFQLDGIMSGPYSFPTVEAYRQWLKGREDEE